MKFPNIKKAAIAFWLAAKYFYKHHSLTVLHEVKKHRLAVCESCPYMYKWGNFRQCSVCTCLIHAKVGLITESCPKKLWT